MKKTNALPHQQNFHLSQQFRHIIFLKGWWIGRSILRPPHQCIQLKKQAWIPNSTEGVEQRQSTIRMSRNLMSMSMLNKFIILTIIQQTHLLSRRRYTLKTQTQHLCTTFHQILLACITITVLLLRLLKVLTNNFRSKIAFQNFQFRIRNQLRSFNIRILNSKLLKTWQNFVTLFCILLCCELRYWHAKMVFKNRDIRKISKLNSH